MTTKHLMENESQTKTITNAKGNSQIVAGLPIEDCSQIRGNPRYSGQLAYIKEFLISDEEELDASLLAERLDISNNVAKLLLHDCYNGCSDNEDEEQ